MTFTECVLAGYIVWNIYLFIVVRILRQRLRDARELLQIERRLCEIANERAEDFRQQLCDDGEEWKLR